MFKGLDEVKETLEFRGEDIKYNQVDTDDFLVEDIMLALGYNKKKDRGVKNIKDGDINWEIKDGGEPHIAVMVLGYKSIIDEERLNRVIKNSTDTGFPVLIVTDGVMMSLYVQGQKTIEIENIYTDKAEGTLELLTKENFNIENIISLAAKEVTVEDIKIAIQNNSLEIAKPISIQLGFKEHDAEKLQEVAAKLIEMAEGNNSEYTVEQKIELNMKLKSKESEIRDLSNKLLDAEDTINYLKKQLEDNNDGNKDTEELERKLQSAENRIKELQEQLEVGKEYNREIEELKMQLQNAEAKIKDLQEQLKTGNISDDSASNSTIDSDDSIYRQKIEELQIEIQRQREEIKGLRASNDEMQRQINGIEDDDVRLAKQLIDSITDDDMERRYVYVVGTKLVQANTLLQFVSGCISSLYDIKGSLCSSYIFDGDFFRLKNDINSTDLILGNKPYSIDLYGMAEIDVIKKIQKLYDNFDDVIFYCKTIGRANVIREAVSDGYEELDSINIDDSTIEGAAQRIEESEEENLIGIPFNMVKDYLWQSENLGYLRAINNDGKFYSINTDYTSETYLWDAFNDGIMALVSCSDNVSELLDEIDNKMAYLTESNYYYPLDDGDARVLNSNYAVYIDDATKLVDALVEFGEAIGIDASSLFFCFLPGNEIDNELSKMVYTVHKSILENSLGISKIANDGKAYVFLYSEGLLDKQRLVPGVYSLEGNLYKNINSVREGDKWKGTANDCIIRYANMMVQSGRTVEAVVNVINNKIGNGIDIFIAIDSEDVSENHLESNGVCYIVSDNIPALLKMYCMRCMQETITKAAPTLDYVIELDYDMYSNMLNDMDTSISWESMAGKLFLETIGNRVKQLKAKME